MKPRSGRGNRPVDSVLHCRRGGSECSRLGDPCANSAKDEVRDSGQPHRFVVRHRLSAWQHLSNDAKSLQPTAASRRRNRLSKTPRFLWQSAIGDRAASRQRPPCRVSERSHYLLGGRCASALSTGEVCPTHETVVRSRTRLGLYIPAVNSN